MSDDRTVDVAEVDAASDAEKGDVLPEQNVQLAMLDMSDAAAFGGDVENMAVGSDGQAVPAETETKDDDDKALGIGTTPLIIGGIALLGGGIAIAAGGGGKENRAPTTSATQSVTVPEDSKISISVSATDPDGDALTFSNTSPSKGTVTGSNGSYVYVPNKDFNGSDTFTVTVSDGKGGTATQTVNITVSPVNDAPVAAAASASVLEDAITTGKLTATDVDAGAVLTFTLDTPVAGLVVSEDGSFTFDASVAAYQSLAAGDTLIIPAGFTVTDDKGATSKSTLTVTVTGVNDAPVAVIATAKATEDATTTGKLTATDVDTGAVLSFALDAPVAGLTVASDGSFTFDGANAAYQSLAAGATKDVVGSFTVTDDKGATSKSTLTVTVTGVNDAPVAVIATAKATEDATTTGKLTATDVDTGAVLSFALDAPVAGLTVASDGSFTFDGANAAYQSLAAGATKDVVGSFTVTDDKGATSKSTLTVTVTGVNDVPVVAASQTVDTKEDTASVPFVVAASDIDVGDVISWSAPATSTQGGAVTGGADGKFVYVPLANFNGTDSVVVTVSDDKGGKSTQTVSFNVVSDPNETQSIDVASDAVAVTYDAAGVGFTAGDNFKFTDNISQPTNARIINFTKGDTIEVSGLASDYSFNNNASGDLLITFNNSAAGVLNQIVLVGVLPAGFTGFISDETSAEAALGYEFFSGLALPGGGAGGTLDADNDGNVLTPRTFSAAGADVAFTEDALVANTVRITDFGIGDTITASNATTATYSFGGTGTDIQITANVGGVISEIVLVNANAGGAIITSEASAEAAVGSNFFQLAAASTPPASTPGTGASIDNGATLATFGAATGSFNFLDDASKETNVVITGFTSDDRISVSGASQADYSFGTGTDPNDLQITFNNSSAGVANVIILDDVLVGKSDFVFDYNSARAALGFDFMVFG